MILVMPSRSGTEPHSSHPCLPISVKYESRATLNAVGPRGAGEYTWVLLHNAKEYSTCFIVAA